MPEPSSSPLADRLKSLRLTGFSEKLSQASLGEALKVTSQQVSNWERGSQIPPTERLESYARLFARQSNFEADEPRLIDARSLSGEEREQRDALIAELTALREGVMPSQTSDATRPVAEKTSNFWRFPDDGLDIVIIASRQLPELIQSLAEADPVHPDYQRTLLMADPDTVLELYGAVRAANPGRTVSIVLSPPKPEEVVRSRPVAPPGVLSGHVIIVGGATVNDYTAWISERVGLPVTRDHDGDIWDRQFVVEAPPVGVPHPLGAGTPDGRWIFKPRLRTKTKPPPQWPSLQRDIALIARMHSPTGTQGSATLLYGLFARGTYGAARIFTDPALSRQNEAYLSRDLYDPTDFWALFWVECDRANPSGQDITTDLSNPANVILTSDQFARTAQ